MCICVCVCVCVFAHALCVAAADHKKIKCELKVLADVSKVTTCALLCTEHTA
jgi:hypothetical protein